MKTTTKTGIFFGIGMSIFFIADGLLTQENASPKETIFTIAMGGVAGSVCGLGFGWIMRKFTQSGSVAKMTKIELPPSNHILLQSPANHFKGIEAVGGKLYMTGKDLIFRSHSFNIQNHTYILPRSEIAGVKRYRVLGLRNSGLMITTKQQTKERFVVEDIEKWLKIFGEKAD